MKRNILVRFGSMALASAVLITGAWYTQRETEDLSIPQLVEFIDTEDGSIVIPQEEVPLAVKPTVKIQKSTKKNVKKSKLKKKAKKTAKSTKRTKKTKTVKKENSKQKVSTATTVLTTVVSATKKNSNIKTVTTTVVTTIKTTTTNKPKSATTQTSGNTVNTAASGTAAQNTAVSTNAASDELQTVSNVTVRTAAPKAHANVLSAFENLEFKIEINPASSYSGYFSVKAHNIILKKKSGDTIYHELGHFVGWLSGNVDTSSEFSAIFSREKDALESANYKYLTQNSSEYFAESYKDFVLSPQKLQSSRPQTYEFMQKAVARITDARVANIKTAYMKTYWA